VKAAIATFVVDITLEFIDAFRFQHEVSPDYFNFFWQMTLPIFLVGLALGVFALLSKHLKLTAAAPMVLFLLAFYSIDGARDYYQPPGWPTPIPQWIHMSLIAVLLLLLFSRSSTDWYQRDRRGEAA
jgi:hypothetical protein